MVTGSALDWEDVVEFLLEDEEVDNADVSIDVSFDAAMVGLSLASEHLGDHLAATSDVSIGHEIADGVGSWRARLAMAEALLVDGSWQEIGCR